MDIEEVDRAIRISLPVWKSLRIGIQQHALHPLALALSLRPLQPFVRRDEPREMSAVSAHDINRTDLRIGRE